MSHHRWHPTEPIAAICCAYDNIDQCDQTHNYQDGTDGYGIKLVMWWWRDLVFGFVSLNGLCFQYDGSIRRAHSKE